MEICWGQEKTAASKRRNYNAFNELEKQIFLALFENCLTTIRKINDVFRKNVKKQPNDESTSTWFAIQIV